MEFLRGKVRDPQFPSPEEVERPLCLECGQQEGQWERRCGVHGGSRGTGEDVPELVSSAIDSNPDFVTLLVSVISAARNYEDTGNFSPLPYPAGLSLPPLPRAIAPQRQR